MATEHLTGIGHSPDSLQEAARLSEDSRVQLDDLLANILVIDLEATCDDPPFPVTEILEVGAVWVAPDGQILDRFQSFVRPIERPQLTDFCKRLLPHIDQATIDAAPIWGRPSPQS